MPSPVQNLECSWGVKWYQVALVLCDDMDLCAVSGFVLSTEVQRKDGVFERLNFYDLQPVDIELGGTWTFEINKSPEKIKRLLEL